MLRTKLNVCPSDSSLFVQSNITIVTEVESASKVTNISPEINYAIFIPSESFRYSIRLSGCNSAIIVLSFHDCFCTNGLKMHSVSQNSWV